MLLYRPTISVLGFMCGMSAAATAPAWAFLGGACGPGAGDCCSANGTPGCDCIACCECICECDPFCCDSSWDSVCAGDGVDGFCGASNPNSSCVPECAACFGGSCPSRPVCGDRTCDPSEDSCSCLQDCPGACCGDGACQGSETACDCSQDCPGPCCGDGACESGENCASCPADCGSTADLNGDGIVGPLDLAMLLAAWGPCE